MKKLFTLAAVLVAALAMNAAVVYDWAEGVAANQKGTTTIVSKVISSGDVLENITASTVKYDENKTQVAALKFSSSYIGALKNKAGKDSLDAGGNKVQTLNYIELAVTGGFKKGDVVKFKACYNTSGTKSAKVDVRNNNDESLYTSDDVINGKEVAGDMSEGSYTLEADQAVLRVGRSGNTTLFIASLVVERTATAIDNTEIDAKIVKTFENGQLVIIKNGVKYNATGAIVK